MRNVKKKKSLKQAAVGDLRKGSRVNDTLNSKMGSVREKDASQGYTLFCRFFILFLSFCPPPLVFLVLLFFLILSFSTIFLFLLILLSFPHLSKSPLLPSLLVMILYSLIFVLLSSTYHRFHLLPLSSLSSSPLVVSLFLLFFLLLLSLLVFLLPPPLFPLPLPSQMFGDPTPACGST